MTHYNIRTYAQDHWKTYISNITELSKDESGHSLVDSNVELYSFDQICGDLSDPARKPASTDGICVQTNTVTFIEFKSGFKNVVPVDKLDPEMGKCDCLGGICNDYWREFRKRREKEKEVLISSICMKAIESYILFEKQIMPSCEEKDDNQTLIKLMVVIDEDEADGMIDILSRQSNDQSRNTIYKRIKASLCRLRKNHDINGKDYYYDDIDVISAIEFEKRAHLYTM